VTPFLDAQDLRLDDKLPVASENVLAQQGIVRVNHRVCAYGVEPWLTGSMGA
jgi:hypothetical protein